MDMDMPSGDIGDLGRSGVEVMAERDVDAIEMLTQDHRMIEELFKRYEELESGDEDERSSVVGEISEVLRAHAAIEELAFYPAVRDVLADGDLLVEEAEHEHQEIKDNLDELKDLDAGEARFEAAVSTLISNVRHHVREEEGGIFPRLRSAIGEPQLIELGRRLIRAKEAEAGEPIVSIIEEEAVVSLFEPSESAPAVRPARPRTAKRPTQTRATRRPKKATSKRSTAKAAAPRKAAPKKATRKSDAPKPTGKRSTAKPSARKATRKPTKRSTAKRPSTKSTRKAATRKTGTKKPTTRRSAARRASSTKAPSRKAPSRKAPSRARSRTTRSR